MAYKFEALTKEKSKIVFICMDTMYKIQRTWTKELIKNIADYQVQNITSSGYDLLTAITEENGLKQCEKDYTHAVVYTVDTEFEGDKFFTYLEELVKTDFFIAGHILDRKEGYYELHEQCYVINLKKWVEYDYPDIGAEVENEKHLKAVPIRSEENYHDNHTPLWIKPGKEMIEYKDKWHGWNILNVALDNDEDIVIFDQKVRDSKKCYYAEYDSDFQENSQRIYQKYNFAANRLYYPTNTEKLQDVNIKGPISQLIVPASGFNWLLYLDKYGHDENTEVIFYDYNPNALWYMKETINKFNGHDYHKFLKGLIKDKAPDWFQSKQEIVTRFSKVAKLRHLKDDIKTKFIQCDLLNEFNIDINNDENTIFNISNIFAYEPTVAFITAKQRLEKENKLLRILKEKSPKIQLVVSVHAWDGLSEYKRHSGPVEKFDEMDLEDLKAPLWRFGEDWKNLDEK